MEERLRQWRLKKAQKQAAGGKRPGLKENRRPANPERKRVKSKGTGAKSKSTATRTPVAVQPRPAVVKTSKVQTKARNTTGPSAASAPKAKPAKAKPAKTKPAKTKPAKTKPASRVRLETKSKPKSKPVARENRGRAKPAPPRSTSKSSSATRTRKQTKPVSQNPTTNSKPVARSAGSARAEVPLDITMRYERNLLHQWCYINARSRDSFEKQRREAMARIADVESRVAAKEAELSAARSALEERELDIRAREILLALTAGPAGGRRDLAERVGDVLSQHRKIIDLVHDRMHNVDCRGVSADAPRLAAALSRTVSLLSQLPVENDEQVSLVRKSAAATAKLTRDVAREWERLEASLRAMGSVNALLDEELSLRAETIEARSNDKADG